VADVAVASGWPSSQTWVGVELGANACCQAVVVVAVQPAVPERSSEPRITAFGVVACTVSGAPCSPPPVVTESCSR
jgi:hypothetical protein